MTSFNSTLLRTIFCTLLGVLMMTGCATYRSDSSNRVAGDEKILGEQHGEVSLRSDRSDLDQARKDIPDEIKKQNDEIAMLMSFVVRDSEEEPSRLRERFSTALRKKRDAIDKKVRRARDDFSKKEKADRDAFLKKSKADRDRFVSGSSRRSSDDRKRFFDDQEDARKSFFADQQEKRKDFESRINDERKDSEDFIREKQNAFNQELRGYQARYTERKRQLDLKKDMEKKSREMERAGKPVQPVTPATSVPSSAGAAGTALPAPGSSTLSPSPYDPTAPQLAPTDPMAEFDKIPPGPGTPLSPGKNGP